MKGFILVDKNTGPLLISINAIAIVSPAAQETTRIQFTTQDKGGNMEKIFVKNPFTEVVKLIEEASE